jgi:MFS family permease
VTVIQQFWREANRPTVAFTANGALYGSLLARYPEIADRVHASNSEFGLALFASALGGLAGSLLSRLLIRRFGELGGTIITGSGYSVFCVAIASASQLWMLSAAFLVTGLFDGAHDVAMNSYTVLIQQRQHQVILGRMHAMWSLAMVAAGALGAGAVALHVPVITQVAVLGACTLVAHLAMLRWRGEPMAASESQAGNAAAGREAGAGAIYRRPELRATVLLLGVAAFSASYIENPGQEWTGLMLGRGMHASAQLAAAAPVIFSMGLVVSRLLLGPGTARYGIPAMARASSAVIAVAMTGGFIVSAAHGSAYAALLAVGIGGIGAGPAFPLLFGAADHMSARHEVPASSIATTVSALSRVGAISAPVATGFLTGSLGLPVIFIMMAAAGVVLLLTLPRGAAGSERGAGRVLRRKGMATSAAYRDEGG